MNILHAGDWLKYVRLLVLAGQILLSFNVFADGQGAQAMSVPAPVVVADSGAQTYHILPGDALDIAVWGEPSLQLKQVRVLPDGSLSYPLAGRIVVEGLDTTQVEAILTQKLGQYLKSPWVTVMVSETYGNVAYVLGKIEKPGPVALNRPMTVLQVLSVAGAFNKFADTTAIRLLRETPTGRQVMTIDYDEMAKGRQLDNDIDVEAGDTILVP